MNRKAQPVKAFLCSCFYLFFMLAGACWGTYPVLLAATTGPANDITLSRAYRSKVDGKIAAVTVLTIVVLIAAGASLPGRNHETAIALHAVSLFCLAICVWTLLGTYYVIDAASLVVRSGPFHWIVALRDIHSVRPTRDTRSGPALSFDRLRIEYGAGRALLVSPREKDAFLADLARRGVHGVDS